MAAVESLVKFNATLLRKEEVAERTLAFRFTKPEHWVFKPGQFVDLTLIDPPETDDEGNTRAFSIASAPFEENILSATRMRESAFKRTLATLETGAEVEVQGPFGSFTLHNNPSKPAVFLAGGIGITPVRSILVHAAREALPHRIVLLYANRRPRDAAFLQELEALGESENITVVPVMTEVNGGQRQWRGETGYITAEMLAKYLESPDGAIYYVSGPPRMVRGVIATLHAFGVDDDDIRADEFPGY